MHALKLKPFRCKLQWDVVGVMLAATRSGFALDGLVITCSIPFVIQINNMLCTSILINSKAFVHFVLFETFHSIYDNLM